MHWHLCLCMGVTKHETYSSSSVKSFWRIKRKLSSGVQVLSCLAPSQLRVSLLLNHGLAAKFETLP